MPLLKKMVPSLLCSATLLTGCAEPAPRLMVESRLERVTPPPSLLICQESPEPPVAPTQRAVAAFVVQIWEAGEDCRGKLASLRDFFSDASSSPP
jgi:hypothetical protein